MREGAQLPYPLWVCHSHTSLDVLWNVLGLGRASLCWYDWLNQQQHWLINLQQLFPACDGRWTESYNTNPLEFIKQSNSPGNQPPSLGIFQSHFINLNSGMIKKHLLWITRHSSPWSFWSYFRNWSYLRTKDQIL